MEKLNDYFLNLLSNPTFSAEDFTLVGLSIDNTSIQDENVYLNSSYILNLDIFKTNGSFDKSKLDNFYKYAKTGLQDLAKIKEIDDIGNTWRAYRNDISMPENLRDTSPLFKIQKVANPLRLLEGFVDFGLRENPTQSIREIALAQLTENPETGELEDSPNDLGFFKNIFDPKVLATYDEDGTHKDPITGEIVKHKKGDRKLNSNGTYYYESLGNRSIYGKDVLSAFDTITTDGSTWNKLDFLDSDDIEKTTGGSLMRAAAQILPAFIPGVGEWYIGARVALGLSLILPAVGKTLESFVGIDTENSFFNKIEAFDKALSFSLSDYTQGSQTDEGQVLSDSHLWSMETGLKLIADVFTLLAELRWMFEKSTSLFSGLSKKVITSKEAQLKWIEDYVAKNSTTPTLEEILSGIAKGSSPETTRVTAQWVNWAKALEVLKGKLKGALELGSKLSLAYMTGITTANSYGEAKLLGASDVEAALFTLGYTFAEWKLLNSDLGKWILPELKSEERHIGNVINKAMPAIKKASEKANTQTEIGKVKWYLKLYELGKKAYHNNLGEGIGNETLGSTISNMASEALEETSEELLLDLAKTTFNIATSLVGSDSKFDDAFENVFDRYALSFVGGALGGGIAGTLPAYRSARADRQITQEMATKELVDIVLLGKDKELLKTVDKMTFGNKYLDEEGNLVEDYTKSLDYMIKLNFKRLVTDIKDILTVNGANLDLNSLLKELGTLDIRYGIFSTLAAQKSNSINWYLNRYNELSSQLVEKSLELKDLLVRQTDKELRKEDLGTDEKEKHLKEEIKSIKEELDKFKDGTMSDEFIMDALFEMSTKISGAYVPNDPDRWIEQQTGKSIDELNDNERKEWAEKFNNSKPLRRDLTRLARQVHLKNMEYLSKIIENYNEDYFKSKKGLINNLEKVIFGDKASLNPELAVPQLEQYLTLRSDSINEFLARMQESILLSLDKEQAKSWTEKLDLIGEINTSLVRELGLESLPKTLEELQNLDEEKKKTLFATLGKDISDLDSLIEDYTIEETNPETGEVVKKLDTDLLQSGVKNWEKLAREEQALKFNSTWIAFLSDENVKKEIINRLSSAKYISPSVKLALTDFFTATIEGNIFDENWNPKIDEVETWEPEVVTLRLGLINEYLNSFKDKPNSPVDEYLNNVTKTLKSKGIQISPLVTDMEALVSKLAKARTLDSFSYTDEIEKAINQALDVIELAKVGLDSAATSIHGDLSDAFGLNVSINEIRAKRGKTANKLAVIPADVAEGIKLDIQKYEIALKEFKTIQAFNSNQALKEHDKAFKTLNINIYNKIKSFVGHLEAGDWKDIDKLKTALDKTGFEDLLEVEEINLDFKEKMTKARIALDKAVHDFFLSNNEIFNVKTDKDRITAIEHLLLLLKALNFLFSLNKDFNTVINSEEKSLPDKDLLWYFASMAAADPNSVMAAYSKVISALYAPVIGQEEAIRTATSFLVNPKIFELFADAYNENILEKAKEDKEFREKQAPYLIINAFRSIFLEGLPGSGKSTAVLKTITDIVHEIDPTKLKKVIVVSNSKENSNRLAEGLKFAETSEVLTFGIEEFKSKIMNNYKTFDVDSTGAIKVEQSDVKYNKEKHAYEYNNFSLNADGLEGTFLIIDEATSLSLMDALMIDKFQESKGIYGLYAGDFDQIGLSGKITIEKDDKGNPSKYALVTLDATNYISTHKLGLVIRGNNTYKSDNNVKFRENKYLFTRSLERDQKIVPVTLSYYLDDTGVFGDIVAEQDTKTTASERVHDLDLGTKDIIDRMINTLREGEKINYIFDSLESPMYKYLTEKYSGKLNLVSTKAAQSQEGQYYIVDISVRDNLESNFKGEQEALNMFKNLYTAMSRAKLATLIFDRNMNAKGEGIISERLHSIRLSNLVKSNIGLEARAKYAKERVQAIKNSILESSKLSFNWAEKSVEEKKEDPTIKKKEIKNPPDTNEEDVKYKKIDDKNNPKDPNIKNESEDSLNMMIHSFNTHECGGLINDAGELELSERSEDRIDNAHGIVKALGLSVIKYDHPYRGTSYKLSKEDTKKVLEILHKSRSAGLYETTPDNIQAKIRKAFNLTPKDSLEVNFIYRNSQTSFDPDEGKGPINKFFRGALDKLMHLFNPTPNEKIETPPNKVIGLEIFINGKQIEIPIGTLTSPATLILTKGFEKLKDIYINSGENLKKFEAELKRIKAESIRTGINPNIPHLNSMLKLLEIYLWNYNHTTPNQDFSIRFNKDFVLNTGKITGVQTPPKERGLDYKDLDYWYVGEKLSLDLYRIEMPDRKISDIYENLGEDIIDSEGNVALEHGIPFILVSDYYDSKLNDLALYEQYIKQIKNGELPLITRVYVYLPTESIDYFLYNQQEALKGDEEKRADDVDNSIGNKLTSYRLLSFMLQNNSSFIKVFNDYIDNDKGVHPFNLEQKELSKKRLSKLLDIVKYIEDYEDTLTEDYIKGSKSKLILNFLNQTPESIKTEHPNLYKLFWGNSSEGTKNIGDTNWTMRTILLYEFRKLLFTGLYYEDKNSSPSLHGQIFEISKGKDGSFIYLDFLIDRINALKEDASRNKWEGVMFHSSLEKESEIVASHGSDSYKIARINAEGASFISSKPITINGKLDSTAVIRNVEPMLDEILSKLVLVSTNKKTKEKTIKATSSITEKLSDAEKIKIYDENTGAYLSAIQRNNTINVLEKLLNDALNLLDSSSRTPENINKLKAYIEKNGDPITPRNLLNVLLDENALIKLGNKIKVIKFPTNNFEEVLIRDDNETYYLGKDGRIYAASTGLSIENIDTLNSLLLNNDGREILRGATEIINKRIQELSNNPEQDFLGNLNNIFGEGVIDLTDFQNFASLNKNFLNKLGAIEVSENGTTKYNIEKYLIAYLLSKDRAQIKNLLVELQNFPNLNSKLNYLGYNIDLQKLKEALLVLNQVINNDSNPCIKINK